MKLQDNFHISIIDPNPTVVQFYRDTMQSLDDKATFEEGKPYELGKRGSALVVQTDTRGNIVNRNRQTMPENVRYRIELKAKRIIHEEHSGYLPLGLAAITNNTAACRFSNYVIVPITTDARVQSSEPSHELASKALFASVLLYNRYDFSKKQPIQTVTTAGIGTGDERVMPIQSALIFAQAYKAVEKDLEGILKRKSL